MVYLAISYASRTADYDKAPICRSTNEIRGCRLQGSALVTARYKADTDVKIVLVFAGISGKTFTAYFPQEIESSLPAMPQGSTVTAELWQGNVTVVAGAKTLDNPDTLPTDGPPVAAFFGLVTLIIAAFLTYFIWVDRRAKL